MYSALPAIWTMLNVGQQTRRSNYSSGGASSSSYARANRQHQREIQEVDTYLSWRKTVENRFNGLPREVARKALPCMLQQAALRGENEAFRNLLSELETPTDLLRADHLGINTLEYMAIYGRPDLLETLLEKWPVSPEVQDRLQTQSRKQRDKREEYSRETQPGWQVVSQSQKNLAVEDILYDRTLTTAQKLQQAAPWVQAGADMQMAEIENQVSLSAERGNLDRMKLLLALRANPNAERGSALREAAQNGFGELVETMLEYGADTTPKVQDDYYENYNSQLSDIPLHVAARNGRLGVVKVLAKYGAELNDIDWRRGRSTALHQAAEQGHWEVVTELLNLGANPNLSSDEGYTPLQNAARAGNLAVVQAMVNQHGALVNQADRSGNTALHRAIRNGHLPIATFLLNAGADVNAHKDGNTPLYVAAQHGNLDMVEFLVSRGANLNQETGAGATPLLKAAEQNHWNVVEFLAQQPGINSNVALQNGETPLAMAAKEGKLDIVNALLEHGADGNRMDQEGRTALYRAARAGHVEIVDLLAKQPRLQLDRIDVNGDTLLSKAAREDLRYLALVLIDKGVNVNPQGERLRWSPLAAAASRGHLPMVKFLIHKQADVNQVLVQPGDDGNQRRVTPLDLVIAKGRQIQERQEQKKYREVAQYLRRQGALTRRQLEQC